jgi:Ras family
MDEQLGRPSAVALPSPLYYADGGVPPSHHNGHIILYHTNDVNQTMHCMPLLWVFFQTEFNRLRVITYPGTKVIIVCFSVVRPRSLESVFERWLPEFVSYCGETIPVILVGTQTDLRQSTTASLSPAVSSSITQLLPEGGGVDRMKHKPEADVVTTKQGIKAANRIGADCYVECSALDRTGLVEVFSRAAAAGRSNVIERLSSPSSMSAWRMKRRQRALERVASRSSSRSTTKSTRASDLIASLMHCWQRRKTSL